MVTHSLVGTVTQVAGLCACQPHARWHKMLGLFLRLVDGNDCHDRSLHVYQKLVVRTPVKLRKHPTWCRRHGIA